MDVFNQPCFLQNGVDLAGGFQIIDRRGLLDHLDDPRPAALVQIRGRLKVAAHPAAQILGLADVQYLLVGVLHKIQTRPRRKALDRFPYRLNPIVSLFRHCKAQLKSFENANRPARPLFPDVL
jgi:hypothetical protein